MMASTKNTASPEKQRNTNTLIFDASPHIRERSSSGRIMADVLIALAPAILGSLFLFGFTVLPLYLSGICGALAADVLVQLIKKRRIDTFDGSPVVTAVLIAMSLPSTIPLWIPALASAIGIIAGKELFGGIGSNFLNPALAGRLAVRLAFPGRVTQSPLPSPPFGFGPYIDAVSSATVDGLAGATPLRMLRDGKALANKDLLDSFLGLVGGKLGETSALLLIIGAAWLIWRRVIRLRIPLTALGAMAVMAFVFGGSRGLCSADWRIVLGHLLGGGAVMAAFFMAADYGSSPTAPLAQYIFAALFGIINMLFRFYSPMNEGVTFSLLLANCTVPLLNRFVRQRVYGEKRCFAVRQQ